MNPALEAVKKLDGLLLAGARVHTVEIPTVRGKAIAKVKDAIAAFNPDIVICIGQAGGRTDLTVERVAINCDDFRIGDNEGNQPVDESVVPGGPAAYFATLPIKKMVAALQARGIPAKVSNTAGTFVCNHVFYGLMDLLAHDSRQRRGGFIHVPYLPEQAARLKDQPSMPGDYCGRLENGRGNGGGKPGRRQSDRGNGSAEKTGCEKFTPRSRVASRESRAWTFKPSVLFL